VSAGKGLIAGAFGLLALDVATQDLAAAGRLQGGFASAVKVVTDFLDPTKPLIPDLRTSATSSPAPVTETPQQLQQGAKSGGGIPATSGGQTPGYPYNDIAPGTYNESGAPSGAPYST
jgi:hypothetical protein